MAALLGGGEVISVHCGGAGANLGVTEWQLIAKEHHLLTTHQVQAQLKNAQPAAPTDEDPSTLCSQNLSPYFSEAAHRYVPRAIFVDSDPSVRLGGIFEAKSPLRHFFRPQNVITSREGSSGVRAKAIANCLSDSALLQRYTGAISHEVEQCDGLQAVRLTAHVGGGAGSGLAGTILAHLRDELGAKAALLPTVLLPTLQDFGGRNHSVELFNAVLSLPELAETADLALLFDNEALYDVCFRLVSAAEPGWRDLNHLVAAVSAGFSAPARFPALHRDGSSVSRLHAAEQAHMLALPRLPFAAAGFAPLTPRGANAPFGALLSSALRSDCDMRYRRAGTRQPSVREVTEALFRPSNFFLSADPLGQASLRALAVFRGPLEPGDVVQEVNYKRTAAGASRARHWSQWMPRRFTLKVCPQAGTQLSLSAAFAVNGTAVGCAIARIADQARRNFEKRVFLHPFVEAGADLEEFEQKFEACAAVMDRYTAHFRELHAAKLGEYTNLRDLGKLDEFSWNVRKTPDFVFDTHKPIEVDVGG